MGGIPFWHWPLVLDVGRISHVGGLNEGRRRAYLPFPAATGK